MELPKETYKGKVIETSLGSVSVGGSNGLPFLDFESKTSKPIIGMEIIDEKPDWPEKLLGALGKVVNDPVKWAKFCVEKCGAKILYLKLESTNPEGSDKSPEEAAEVLKKIQKVVDVPIIVYGTGAKEKDNDVLKKCAEACKNLILANAEEENYKSIAGAALAYNQKVIAFSPIDINIAKQMNILLTEMGLKKENILIDPLASPLGFGLEYSYSVIERIRISALQGDEMLQMPMIVTAEGWGAREAQDGVEKLGVNWEIETSLSYIISGADIIIVKHPDSAKKLNEIIGGLME